MVKLVLEQIYSGWATFKAEVKTDPGNKNTIPTPVQFQMTHHEWEKQGRPVELFITIEGFIKNVD